MARGNSRAQSEAPVGQASARREPNYYELVEPKNKKLIDKVLKSDDAFFSSAMETLGGFLEGGSTSDRAERTVEAAKLAAGRMVYAVESQMDELSVNEYTRLSDAGRIDLMKHNTYDKWMRSRQSGSSEISGKEFVEKALADAAEFGASKYFADKDRAAKVQENFQKYLKLMGA
jgi:hypothetical protein